MKNVLKGLHYQKKHPQTTLMKVIRDEVYDVAVVIRKGSSTHGIYHDEILSEKK